MNVRKFSTSNHSTAVVPKGHFAVYTREGQRFVVPIEYLKSNIFVELLRLSEEEFGLPLRSRPITLPCDAAFLEHVVASLKRLKKPCAAAPFFMTSA
ncbi:auxin-responsive protein SAUR36-like [Canna indica]|uniref:Auxin-responsive protein SAUR36-like n=1 Tax=Canna indica TaxID=4628 RepID=A0AAQ3QJF3_9LILI|nr:auxin-responsive protein SAUR36-like [Canna indica]